MATPTKAQVMTNFQSMKSGLPRRLMGFSLIEVMVAVVILATGLLALAALQGALARGSADAKARSAVMAALTSRMSEIRRAPPTAGKIWTMGDTWVATAAAQAGASDLSVTETIETHRWNGTAYVTSNVSAPDSLFTRATLTAAWTGADGPKSLGLASDLSALMYGDDGYPLPPDETSSASKFPVMRRKNPGLTEGVIPIAFGTSATAASNPQPDIEGPAATRFEVVTYIPEGATAKIAKRFDTKAINCRCVLGSNPDGDDVRAPQWPVEWTGEGYQLYKADQGASPPGAASPGYEDPDYSGASRGRGPEQRKQSPQCTECCRDYRPSEGAGIAFDPEDPTHSLKNVDSSGALVDVAGKFVASCRVIQSAGFWRTATDMYSRHFALLKTATKDGKVAGSGVPEGPSNGDCSAVGAGGLATCLYQGFVKQYLAAYDPAGAQTVFDTYASGALNSPTRIDIPSVSPTDRRYLHARGLYVDYLGIRAQEKITQVKASCGASAECLLPYLPFISINVTELAKWSRSDTAISVVSQTRLGTEVREPFGGRTTGVADGTARAISAMRLSNSGLASGSAELTADGPNIFGGVDATDAAQMLTDSDNQVFRVGTGGGGEELPYITVRRLDYDYAFPSVTRYVLDVPADCTLLSTERRCYYAAGILPGVVSLDISNYNLISTDANTLTVTNPCQSNKTTSMPYQRTFDITAVSPLGTLVVSNNGLSNESTRFTSAGALAANDVVTLTFGNTVTTCPGYTCGGPGNNTPVWNSTFNSAQCAAVGVR